MSRTYLFRAIVLAGCFLLPPTGTHARGQEVTPDDPQVKPLQILTRENLIAAAQFGIGIAVDLNPGTKTVKEAADITKIVMEQSVKAADFRNEVVQSHLLVVSQEAEKLKALRERDGDLKSPEAQAILDDLRRGHFSEDSTAMFLAKSVFSLRMAYGVASTYATDKLSGKIAEGISKQFPNTGGRVELMWIGKRSFVRTHTDIPWKYLARLGTSSRLLTNAFQKVLLKKIGQRIGRYAVESTLDKTVEDILRDHPSIPEATLTLRADAMVRPELLLPMAQAQPAMAAPLAMPAVIRAQPDLVVRAASVQQQIIVVQHNEGSSGRGGSNYEPPVERHPTHNLPRSVNIGGSFTGGSGSSLFSRF